jgi:hypothetical protein
MELFSFLNDIPYLDVALQLALAAHALALAIVNLTDTPKDNEALAKAYRYIEFMAGIVKSSKVKQ